MSVPNSVEELVQLIRKSGMVDEAKLSAYLQRREFARGLPTDPREFADDMTRDGVLTNFQAEQFLLGKWRGFTIGKYKLLERVGVGGMGQVFLCEHMFMKKRVAIKVLPPAKADQPAALGRFYREARAAGSVQHPNIVRTHDIDQDGNLHFIVMDYVDGSNLLDVVKKHGPMDLGRAASYVRQTACALDHAFRNGIIHRDIKPSNLLVSKAGIVKVSDMGLARVEDANSDSVSVLTKDGFVVGTPDFISPEQARNAREADIRSDIYSLGCTLYFLLTGEVPFPKGTQTEKALSHTREPIPEPTRTDLPPGLRAVLKKMTAKKPEQRFQLPGEVADALEAFVVGRQTPVTPLPIVVPLSVEVLSAEEPEHTKPSDYATDSRFQLPSALGQKPARHDDEAGKKFLMIVLLCGGLLLGVGLATLALVLKNRS